MSVLLLSCLWCTLQVSGFTQISVLFLTHMLRHTYGVLERSLVSLKGHWCPWHFVLSRSRSFVPDMRAVSRIRQWFVWHFCSMSDMYMVSLNVRGICDTYLICLTRLWYLWHIFVISDTSMISLTHLSCSGHIFVISDHLKWSWLSIPWNGCGIWQICFVLYMHFAS